MPYEFLNPIVEQDWSLRIRGFPGATFFHSAEWATVLSQAYGYIPYYGVHRDGIRLLQVLPLMEVRSVWTGKRAISLPFSDECVALGADGLDDSDLLESVIKLARQRYWRYIELRGGNAQSAATVSDEFFVHRLAVEKSSDAQMRKLRDSTRRNIQKSVREGVQIEYQQGSDAMDAFYALHCQTRRRHGLPPQPAHFFRLIQQIVIAPGHGFVSLARFNHQWIAGAVFFRFGSHAIYKFGASNPQYQHLRANNLLMWSAICRFQEEGIKELSFGRTDLNDEGLLQFKRGWGAEESTLRYYRLPASARTPATKPQVKLQGLSWSRRVMRRLPIPVLRWIGSVAYRHVA